VVERGGRIVALRDGDRAGTFLDIGEEVSTGGERGLLSVAFPPDYERSRRFYVYYTDRNGDIEVDHFRRSPDSPVEALPDSREEIITIPHPGASNHNGGTAAFGPDGKLYIATGDGAVRSQNAQDRGSLLGKLLRIDPQPMSRRDYRIPKGNPYRRRGGENEIFSVGLRNPFRFSFDRRKPILGLADVGESRFEEVNYLRVSEARGANFGWPAFEGRARRGGGVGRRAHDPPMHAYSLSGGNCAITGGFTVRDDALRSLRGRYLYADHCAGELRSFRPRLRGNDARADRALGPEVSSPVAFGEDRDGHVYVVSLDGPVYRLAPKR
jgi:glucose/arabinose dehydrogenase